MKNFLRQMNVSMTPASPKRPFFNFAYVKLIFILLTVFSMLYFSYKSKNFVNNFPEYKILPKPRIVQYNYNIPDTVIDADSAICYASNELNITSKILGDYIFDQTGLRLHVLNNIDMQCNILLYLSSQTKEKEEYMIVSDDSEVRVEGTTPEAVFHGIQTLRKLIPVEKTESFVIHPVTIKDKPRFSYRGLHLDVSRHFFPVSEVKKYIDMIAFHNMNHFHWHLTDDAGWRVEIKKYPLLTKIGATRQKSHANDQNYEGFYTQEDIKEIIKYASERYITIIPEIDVPSHVSPILAAYPKYGCDKNKKFEVSSDWHKREKLCIGNPEMYDFIKDIFSEIIDLFPSKFIHIGGDEAETDEWKKCPICQKKLKEIMKEMHQHDSNESIDAFTKGAYILDSMRNRGKEKYLQSYFSKFLIDFIESKGRRAVAWIEVLDGLTDAKSTVIMPWMSGEMAKIATNKGLSIILTSAQYLYFNFKYDRTPLRHVFETEPMPSWIEPLREKQVLGIQANLWTEYIENFDQLMYMALPRTSALSELQWSVFDGDKDYNKFLERLNETEKFYKHFGWRCNEER